MLDITQLQVGQKVHYQPDKYSRLEWENGVIKEIREGRKDVVWVVYSGVYNCGGGGNWDKDMNYIIEPTYLCDLKLGWK